MVRRIEVMETLSMTDQEYGGFPHICEFEEGVKVKLGEGIAGLEGLKGLQFKLKPSNDNNNNSDDNNNNDNQE